MNAVLQWSAHPVVHRLGLTLLHFLWQGAVVAGLFGMAQTVLRHRSSNARYLAGCLALLLMLAAPVITFVSLGTGRSVPIALAPSRARSSEDQIRPAAPATTPFSVASDSPVARPSAAVPPHPNLNLTPNPAPPRSLAVLHTEDFLRGFVFIWMLGVTALSLRLLLGSWRVARWKRQGHEPVDAAWMERLDRLKAAVEISRPVRLMKSALVEVPTVLGWLRPVILLPAATLSGLSPAQLEAIIAHELAHIRRHDYLVNLLQNALETLLFYHPAVWWISNCVRAEREICCDEIAVQLCGDRLAYAQALTALEQLRAIRPSLALGADGGSLLNRIRRLAGRPAAGEVSSRRRTGGLLVAAFVAAIFVAVLHHSVGNARGEQSASGGTNRGLDGGVLPNAATPTNSSGLSLVICGPTNVIRQGDEIPIEFIISNGGTADLPYENSTDEYLDQFLQHNLVAKTSSGERVPAPRKYTEPFIDGSIIPTGIVRPGETITNIIPLNEFALIMESGHYEIVGSCFAKSIPNKTNTPFSSAPISLEVLPRTKAEMADYIQSWSNQLAAPIPSGPVGIWNLAPRYRALTKLMYTGSPEIIPSLLRLLYDTNAVIYPDGNWLPMKALSCYMPHTEESRKLILDYVATRDLNWDVTELLPDFDLTREELKPIIERALAPTNVPEWEYGADLAASKYGDDAFNPRLIAIARDANSPPDARSLAVEALTCNRSEEGLKTLKGLLADPDVYDSGDLARAIASGYGYPETPTSRHLQLTDFDSKEVRPLVERLLASTNEMDQGAGLELAAVFDDDTLTAKLVALATNAGSYARSQAIRALAFNRTDEGVKILKALLHDPDEQISSETERAIREAYTKRGGARGKLLRADDFDVKFQPLSPDTQQEQTEKTEEKVEAPGRRPSTNKSDGTNQSSDGGVLPNAATAADPSGLSIVIRGPTNVIRQGDEIPIEYTISNHGTNEFNYNGLLYEPNRQYWGYKLVAGTTNGQDVPEPDIARWYRHFGWGVSAAGIYVLHPGESFTETVPLNYWARIKDPGTYEIVGTYAGTPAKPVAPVESAPLRLTVLPRAKEEMSDYIRGLTNQIATRLANRTNGGPADPALDLLLEKLTYTCSPEIVPALLENWNDYYVYFWGSRALMCYVPPTAAVSNAIVAAIAKHPSDRTMANLVSVYDLHDNDNETVTPAPTQPPGSTSNVELSNPQSAIRNPQLKTPETILAEIRAILPENWDCWLTLEAGDMAGFRGLVTNSRFRVDFTNLNVAYSDYHGGGSARPPPHPCLSLYFVPVEEMGRLQRGTNSIWNQAVIRVGETSDYGVVTSLNYINHGKTGNVMERSLAPLGWALEKYFGKFADEKTRDVLGMTSESPEGLTTGRGFAGQVVDSETGKPVKEFVVDFDDGDSAATDARERGPAFFGGRFMAQYRQTNSFWERVEYFGGGSSMRAGSSWTNGQKVWPRVLAEGYVPAPLTPEPVTWPVKLTNLVIRLKRAGAPAQPAPPGGGGEKQTEAATNHAPSGEPPSQGLKNPHAIPVAFSPAGVELEPCYDAVKLDKDGFFQTALLDPGDYTLVAEAYDRDDLPETPLPDDEPQLGYWLHIRPPRLALVASVHVTVTTNAAVAPVKVEFHPWVDPAKAH